MPHLSRVNSGCKISLILIWLQCTWAVFIWVLKSNRCNLHLLRQTIVPLFHPIRSKTKTNQDSLARIFLALCFSWHIITWSFDCSQDYLHPLWLARDWLVLVLQHSIENCSIPLTPCVPLVLWNFYKHCTDTSYFCKCVWYLH